MPVVSCGMYTANPARNRPVVAPKCFLHWSRDCCSFQQGGFGHSMQRGLSPMHYCIDRIHKTHAVRSRAETCILVQALSMWERMWCHDRACVCTFDIASDVTPQVAGMRAHGKHVNFEIGNCNWHCTQLRSKGSEPYLISDLCMPDADASLQAEPMFSTSYVSVVPGGWLLEVQHSTCQASAGLTWQSKAS